MLLCESVEEHGARCWAAIDKSGVLPKRCVRHQISSSRFQGPVCNQHNMLLLRRQCRNSYAPDEGRL